MICGKQEGAAEPDALLGTWQTDIRIPDPTRSMVSHAFLISMIPGMKIRIAPNSRSCACAGVTLAASKKKADFDRSLTNHKH
jgi:hypothetical protein